MSVIAVLRHMKILGLAAMLAGSLGTLSAALAEEFDRGEALYENHCRSCHEGWVHSREGRKVKSPEELRARVASWSIHAGLGWGAEEIDDVTRYLNVHFYRFKSQSK